MIYEKIYKPQSTSQMTKAARYLIMKGNWLRIVEGILITLGAINYWLIRTIREVELHLRLNQSSVAISASGSLETCLPLKNNAFDNLQTDNKYKYYFISLIMK